MVSDTLDPIGGPTAAGWRNIGRDGLRVWSQHEEKEGFRFVLSHVINGMTNCSRWWEGCS